MHCSVWLNEQQQRNLHQVYLGRRKIWQHQSHHHHRRQPFYRRRRDSHSPSPSPKGAGQLRRRRRALFLCCICCISIPNVRISNYANCFPEAKAKEVEMPPPPVPKKARKPKPPPPSPAKGKEAIIYPSIKLLSCSGGKASSSITIAKGEGPHLSIKWLICPGDVSKERPSFQIGGSY